MTSSAVWVARYTPAGTMVNGSEVALTCSSIVYYSWPAWGGSSVAISYLPSGSPRVVLFQ
jgi:hypothetical protein